MAEGEKAKPGPKPKAKPEVSPVDMVAAQAAQNLLHDTFGEKKGKLPLPGDAPIKNPTVYVAANNYTISTHGSGPMLVRRGDEVMNPHIIHALLEAGADLRPVR
jgi:hypothetical protein